MLSSDKAHLVGLISCFADQSSLKLFLVAVHPKYQSLGVGNQLMAFVGNKALQMLSKTQVLATNTRAINFYSKWGFRIDSGDLVMHRWRKEAVK